MLWQMRDTRRFAGHLKARIGHFMRQQAGGIAISVSIAMPALLGVGGLATDYFNMVLIRTELQAAADAAALTAASKMTLAGVKKKDVDESVRTTLENAVDPRNGPFSHETKADLKVGVVAVHLTQSWTPFFYHFLKTGVTPVRVDATAQVVGTGNICLLALHPSVSGSVNLTALARIKANDCGVYANSKSSSAVRLDLLGQIEASLICSAGGVFGLLSNFKPAPTTDCPVVEDPLAKLAEPKFGSCDFDDMKVTSGTRRLSPGVYCGGIAVRNDAKVIFEPGTYIIKDGPFSARNSAVLQGTNAGFFLVGDNAILDFQGNATIDLSGQEEGPMAGLLFFEDRNASTGRTHLINASNAKKLTGTVYLPRNTLLINPNARVAADSDYTAIVALRITMTAGPTLMLNSNYDLTSVPVPEGIRASTRVLLTD